MLIIQAHIVAVVDVVVVVVDVVVVVVVDVVVVVVVDVVDVVDGEGVETVPSLHVADSSPMAAKMNLLSLMTLALLETPATPVGVPDRGRTTAGFE